jgi:hypothetical protein
MRGSSNCRDDLRRLLPRELFQHDFGGADNTSGMRTRARGACTPAPLPASRRSTHCKPWGILKSPHATTACGAPSRSSDLNGQGRPPLQGGEGDPKPRVSGVTENGSGPKGLNVVQSRARNGGAEHMNIQEQIKKYITSQPEPKRSDLRELHRLSLQVSPECKLWFFDGKDSKNHTVSNPTIGYGFHTIKYANGKSREFFQIGVSGNKTGISVYVLGLKDKKYLAKTYGKKLGKASVTGYCIRFKALKDINIDTLEAAIRYGLAAQNEKGDIIGRRPGALSASKV